MRRCPSCGTEYEDSVAFCGQDGTITVQVQDPADHDRRLGTQLGDYILVARVADGAMGRVYEGRHPETKQRVAVKVLHDDIAKDEVAVERFKREYETAEEMQHPHIVDVIEFGETGDRSYFLTMEYLQGEELGELLRREGAQKPERALRILCQLCAGLDYAHSFGVIHRDLKPDNVFLTETPEGDVVKVLDFGSVKLQMETGPKLTAFGTTLGSPYYMSPEQAMGKLDVDQRTDVFATAAIAWEMAVGRVCFEGDNVAAILMKIVNDDPPPPSQLAQGWPPAFDDAVLKGVSKDKTQRPGSAGALADAVVRSFGLDGDHRKWAETSQADIASALAAATPPAPAAYGTPAPAASSGSPAASGATATGPQAAPRVDEDLPASSGGSAMPMVIGGLVVLALIGAAAAFFLMG
ncbi:MAG: serine/threonine protein kinase [Sandaracinus sp.]|nr:serine/threonine protein kinase [Sandaracinus sp.]